MPWQRHYNLPGNLLQSSSLLSMTYFLFPQYPSSIFTVYLNPYFLGPLTCTSKKFPSCSKIYKITLLVILVQVKMQLEYSDQFWLSLYSKNTDWHSSEIITENDQGSHHTQICCCLLSEFKAAVQLLNHCYQLCHASDLCKKNDVVSC